jgi:hypothetical protein
LHYFCRGSEGTFSEPFYARGSPSQV